MLAKRNFDHKDFDGGTSIQVQEHSDDSTAPSWAQCTLYCSHESSRSYVFHDCLSLICGVVILLDLRCTPVAQLPDVCCNPVAS